MMRRSARHRGAFPLFCSRRLFFGFPLGFAELHFGLGACGRLNVPRAAQAQSSWRATRSLYCSESGVLAMTDLPDYPHDPRLTPLFTAVGIVATAYAQLEFSMNDAIWELANVSRKAGLCMTAQMIGPGPRCRCLAALLELRQAPPELYQEFNRISKEIEGVAARRNRYMHDYLVINQETGEIARVEGTADRRIKYGFMQTEINELNQLVNDIDKINGQFDAFYERAVVELPAWPRTQFLQSQGIQLRRKGRKIDH
jgi:hypothetical protein